MLFNFRFNRIFFTGFGYGNKIKFNTALAEAYKFKIAGSNGKRCKSKIAASEKCDFFAGKQKFGIIFRYGFISYGKNGIIKFRYIKIIRNKIALFAAKRL